MPPVPYRLFSQEKKDRIIRSVSQRRKRRKARAVAYKGGCCKVCKYDRCLDALHFHHLDTTKKDFTISNGGTLSWKKVVEELDKCILLCGNCHAEVHDGILELKDFLIEEEKRKSSKEEESILDFFIPR